VTVLPDYSTEIPTANTSAGRETPGDQLPSPSRWAGLLFGSVIDPLVDDPPTDVAVVRYRSWRPLHRILVPVAGGPNSRLAVKMAAGMAMVGDNSPVTITLLHVVPPGRDRRRPDTCAAGI
jgi:nucleotide-binding universal stress UspA family protein